MTNTQRFRLSTRVSKKSILYFLLCAVIVRPDYLLSFPIVYRCYSLASVVALTYIVLHLAKNKDHLPLPIKTLIGIFVWLLIATAMNGGSISACWDAIELPLVALFITYIGMKTDAGRFLHSLECLLILYVIINFITVVAFPNGLEYGVQQYVNGRDELVFFLGQKNVVIKFSLLAEFCVIIEAILYYGRCKLFERIISVMVFCVGIYTNSVITVIASILPLIFTFLNFEKVPEWINSVSGAFINLAFFVVIIIMKQQERFAFIIENVLGKNLTFTSRTRLWDIGLLLSSQKIWTGHGVEPKAAVIAKTGFSNDSFHNFIVDYLYQGGIVVLVLWLIFAILLWISIRKSQNVIIARVCNLIAFSFLLVAISEPFTRGRVTPFVIFSVMSVMLIQRDKFG